MPPSELAAARGEPSYVWRSGQERRLAMIVAAAPAIGQGGRVLEAGCGLGAYIGQIARRYTPHVEAFDIEPERVAQARAEAPHALVAAAEGLPYPTARFDVAFSNEVIEHVRDDHAAVAEMVRVLRPGGRAIIFCPNRWYPVEQHGHYWRGVYHFGNTPLINYLPDFLRNRLAPHVRTYTARGLRRLFDGLPVRVVLHTRIFGGYDNIARRAPRLGKAIRAVLYGLERTPLRFFGLSHFLVVEKLDGGPDNADEGRVRGLPLA
jgi:SAM-dependent methyltransferase